MGEQPIGKLLMKFSLPAVIAMIVNATYNIVDTVFVGRLGYEAIAALTVVWPIQLLSMALSVGIGVGANSLISRLLGAGARREANRAAGQAILLGISSGAVLMLVILIWTDPILRLLGASTEILPLSRAYIRIIIWGGVLVFLPMILNNLVRAQGNPTLPMTIMVISAFSNIALDPILIFGLGPFPAMGVRGAAIATIIARGIVVVTYFIYFIGARLGYRLTFSDFIPAPRIWTRIYAVGAPTVAIQIAPSITFSVANNIAAGFSPVCLPARHRHHSRYFAVDRLQLRCRKIEACQGNHPQSRNYCYLIDNRFHSTISVICTYPCCCVQPRPGIRRDCSQGITH